MQDPDRTTVEHDDKDHERHRMVDRQIASRGVSDDRVLEAMRTVPREHFVAPESVEFAYEDTALPIAANQTISQPYVVAVMLQALALKPTDRVLEVGTGSGYAAAVLSHVADQVFTIERHHSLAVEAERVLERHGYDNVQVFHGDGSSGWESEAPFDAILVSAGGSEIPTALLGQLAPGGRLVMPVGDRTSQELKVVRRADDGSLEERELGLVRFVPLIGGRAPGAPDDGAADTGPITPGRRAPVDLDLVRRRAETFDEPEHLDLDSAICRLREHRIVLLGEASHGTSEFYTLRERLTRRLIEEGSVSFVAVEADWPDAVLLDRYVRGIDEPGAHARDAQPFTRFPRWMWANHETLAFLEWLRDFNSEIGKPENRVGFFGLDLYSLHTSIDAVLRYLDEVDPEAATLARARFGCLTPWETDPQTYGRLATSGRLEACEDEVVRILTDLMQKRTEYGRHDGLRYLSAVQNARLVTNAERYYRAMYRSPAASWNLRDRHMFETLQDLLGYHEPESRAVVWAHNSHLGDASATDMGARGQHNLGELCRSHFRDTCYAVGMGTHTGTVMAAHEWGEPGRVMDVRPSLPGSYERLSHDVEASAFLLPLREGRELRRALARERIQRAIGVIYRPETERASHYFHASLPRQFDEWIFFDRTTALRPLAGEGSDSGNVLDTFPFAV